MIEIVDLSGCREWLALGGERVPAALRALDLRDVRGFESGTFADCLFLSCRLTPAQAGYLTTTGATVIRDDPDRPYTAHRRTLYSPDELYAGFDPDADADVAGYEATFDARVYRHWVASGRQYPASISESLARRLHDHSITEALYDAVGGHRPVAVMGGHALERAADPRYAEVATIARTLVRSGLLMLSGGGPGAMEATHLGVWMANFDDAELAGALAVLGPRPPGAQPGREYRDADWLHRSYAVRRRWPLLESPEHVSIGIPTWMYGHEPPSALANRIAKYFANSVREEGLLAIATHGVIFTPGSAGTIQEIFQDAAQNHYSSFGPPSPMVLLGREYWTVRHPVWPVLQSLAEHNDYGDLITLTDDPDEAVATITSHARG